MIPQQLELRMYFFVPYNISPIQQAIQVGHAALEYAHKYKDDKQFINFINTWKTWIILNGGTTNNNDVDNPGTLDCIFYEILEHDANLKNEMVNFSIFKEPDLNDALTAICFICDERVFNKEDYPDWKNYVIDELMNRHPDVLTQDKEELMERFPELYKEWLNKIGGEKNAFLKDLLKDKKLA